MGRPNRESPPRLGVSACLLGHEVRFDGGHKRDRVVTDLLGDFVVWVPICPEVEVGMGVPRPALRLVRDGDEVRMLEVESGRDHTRRMNRFALRRVRALQRLDLSGYVLKKGSPSCGMAGVQILDAEGRTLCEGRGLFASALMEACPRLPIEEEDRLGDPERRESFIERVLAYHRLGKASPTA